MIASDLKFKIINRHWYIVDATGAVVSGPHANSVMAIDARRELVKDDVIATAAKVSRKQAARREKAEAGL